MDDNANLANVRLKSDPELEEAEKRIKIVFSSEKNLAELPVVTKKSLSEYYSFLKNKLPVHLKLTGDETMGYFSWEGDFEGGYGSDEEYEKLIAENGSCFDIYEFINLLEGDITTGLIAKVKRVEDQKEFEIPLVDLSVFDDKAVTEGQLIDDYAIWFVNNYPV